MDFLTLYVLDNAIYNQKFMDDFKAIVEVLLKIVSYEEKTLYKLLQEK